MENSRNVIQRWNSYRPTKAQTFWIALGCIIATLVIGFGLGGWVTGGTAQEMATRAAQESRLELAAAVCAEDFMRAADARERLAKLKKIEWYQRGEVVAAGGWATMPGESEANDLVAGMCATRLAESSGTAVSAPVSSAAAVR
jgi:hypothetical protein